MVNTPAPQIASDVIDALAGIGLADSAEGASSSRALRSVREKRAASRVHAQGSFEALFVPSDDSHMTLVERAAVALFVARLHQDPAAEELYGALLRETGGGPGIEPLIAAEADRSRGEGPYGEFLAENAPESVPGPEYRVESIDAAYALGDRLSAALEHTHFLVLHPRDASRERLQQLLDAGWSTTGIVTLSQLISFLTFQLRVAHGLRQLSAETAGTVPGKSSSETRVSAGQAPHSAATGLAALAAVVAREAETALIETAEGAAGPESLVGAETQTPASSAALGRADQGAPEVLPAAPRVVVPPRFTSAALGWKPWLTPLPKTEFTEQHYDALIERDRVHMPYFRLLARDPAALRARTLTDLDIFFNTDEGLPRADREISAAAASRLNGCVYCASVHARFAIEQGAAASDVQQLLDDGIGARISARWNALFDATVALTATPPRLGLAELQQLREQGLDDLEVLDALQAGAFFNWANRLMLSLGEPTA